MKNFPIFCVLTLLLSGGCARADRTERPSPGGEQTVEVRFRMETALATDTSLEPMTRTETYTNWIANKFRMLVLKKVDTRWVVDGSPTFLIRPDSSESTELMLTDRSIASDFSMEMRPGEYRIVAVTNPRRCVWNEALKPGTVVADESDSSRPVPPLVTYLTSTHFMNYGYWMLNREIFVGVAEFTVPKSDELHASGMSPVGIRMERRVAKFRIMLKDKPSPVKNHPFENKDHLVTMHFVTQGNDRLAEGVGALGDMYYSPEGLTDLPWRLSTTSSFHPYGGERYQVCMNNSTVFSPFLFADPKVEELPVVIDRITIIGGSGGYAYRSEDTFSRILTAGKITGIVFQPNDTYYGFNSQTEVGIDEATDADGKPEDPATLFGKFVEWKDPTIPF